MVVCEASHEFENRLEGSEHQHRSGHIGVPPTRRETHKIQHQYPIVCQYLPNVKKYLIRGAFVIHLLGECKGGELAPLVLVNLNLFPLPSNIIDMG